MSKINSTVGEITSRYRRIIVEVNGSRDLGTISEFVTNKLLAGDSRALRKEIQRITPDLNFTFEHTYSTGDTEALRIPFGVDFFYPAE
mgnify:FL=1